VLASSYFGFPLSTTQVISGGIVGAGAARRLSAVRWGVAGNIVLAWVLTLPAAALMGGTVYAVTRIFGSDSAVGPVVISLVLVAAVGVATARRLQRGSPITAQA
jgi:inorganic phosphate transporter, PiT family